MALRSRGRGAAGRGAASALRAAAAAAADSEDSPLTAAAASVLRARLRCSLRELPGFADALAPAPTEAAQMAGNRPCGVFARPSQERALEKCLQELRSALEDYGDSPHAVELAELLSQEPAAASALLRLHAVALRPSQEGKPAAGGHLAPKDWLSVATWRLLVDCVISTLIVKTLPLPPSRHALSVLRFVRAMLRAQPFHALSRQLAAAAAALEAGSGGGGGASSSGAGSGSGGGAYPGSGGASDGSGRGSGGRAGSSSNGGGAGSTGGGGAGCKISGGAGSSSGGGGAGSSSGGGAGSTIAFLSENVLGMGITLVTAVGLLLRFEPQTIPTEPMNRQEEASMRTLLGVLRELQSALPETPNTPPQPPSSSSAALDSYAHAERLERVACMDDFTRGLAESGFLDQATRLMLALQTSQGVQNGPVIKLQFMLKLWRALERAIGPDRLIWAPPHLGDGFVARSTSPAAAAHLRSALSGRCVQTAVLVYGVGTLRVADRGPSYGLPAELQTAGLALMGKEEDGNRSLSPIALELLLRQLASGSALPPPGPGASLELALRVGRAALGTAVARMPFVVPASCVPPPLMPLKADVPEAVRLAAGALACHRRLLPLKADVPEAVRLAAGALACHRRLLPLKADVPEAVRLAAGALACGRLLLPRQRPSPRLEAQRAEWWRLARWAAAFGMWETEEGSLRQLWRLVTEPLLAVWPDDSLDPGVLPPSAPPEVAAALAAGLQPHLRSMFASASDAGLHYGAASLTALLDVCDEARPGGSGLALFLTPLLAYGDPEAGEVLVGVLKSLSELPPGAADREPFRQAAAAFLNARGNVLGGGGNAGAAAMQAPVAAELRPAAEDPVAPCGAGTAAASEAPAVSVVQLQRFVDACEAYEEERGRVFAGQRPYMAKRR
ncbi:hypothetical protein HYH03_011370 [Edaphochlamys debaryana]|uniref:Uncharacterized protein n=1 Tax=Edaphochlamys debaryana TaxID=47281 RepID=A0A835XUA0_9CHLO|nr:hypothetical protein HYH03_011370 [Edaphochlamys debaryana]|eukprot:KAG2490246.1 hypothetical protein HYH03_011370 [Edaphochlamys debaryana]